MRFVFCHLLVFLLGFFLFFLQVSSHLWFKLFGPRWEKQHAGCSTSKSVCEEAGVVHTLATILYDILYYIDDNITNLNMPVAFSRTSQVS